MSAKLNRLLSSYSFLSDEYNRVLQQRLLAPAIASFRRQFDVGSAYSDQKVVDTLIWKFVGYLRSGAIKSGQILYS